MYIWADLETIPGQAKWVRSQTDASVSCPATYKKPESIEKWWQSHGETAKDTAWRKTALNATLGEIIVIAWAIDDGEIYSVQREIQENEGMMLSAFFNQLKQQLLATDPMTPEQRERTGQHAIDLTWAGHNIAFDLGFLFRRSVINQIKPTVSIPYAAKPWSGDYRCTVDRWKGNSKDSASMEVLCKAFGIDYPDDIDGSRVWDEIQRGNLSKVVEYCKGDVDRARQISNRISFQ